MRIFQNLEAKAQLAAFGFCLMISIGLCAFLILGIDFVGREILIKVFFDHIILRRYNKVLISIRNEILKFYIVIYIIHLLFLFIIYIIIFCVFFFVFFIVLLKLMFAFFLMWQQRSEKNGHPSFKRTSINALHMESALMLTHALYYLCTQVT